MNVSAVIVTRGNVDLGEIVASLPKSWQIVVWDNGEGESDPEVRTYSAHTRARMMWKAEDLAVYGRYAAVHRAAGELIYVQDDDCVVEEPQSIVDRWHEASVAAMGSFAPTEQQLDFIVANMPEPFRHDFYRDHCLVGFGAVFHRDAPARAFKRAFDANLTLWDISAYYRTCDVVFTALTPRILVDIPYRNLEWATAEDRMYRQPEHVAERSRMLELALKVRDA